MNFRSPGFRALVALVLVVAIGYGGWRLFVHHSNVPPALVTPKTDVHAEISEDIQSRIHRIAEDAPLRDRDGRPRLIALTFDDGPYPIFTPLLLDTLRDLHIPATFFLIGRDAEQWPAITRRIEADGDEVADHTYSHPDLDLESDATVRSEILRGRDVLWSFTHDP
ncbi:MAG TPA: polysaccharide deacetylase family protein, partial [Candidatus Tumulicola sp.]